MQIAWLTAAVTVYLTYLALAQTVGEILLAAEVCKHGVGEYLAVDGGVARILIAVKLTVCDGVLIIPQLGEYRIGIDEEQALAVSE